MVAEVRAALQGSGLSLSVLAHDRRAFDSAWFIEHRVEAGALDPALVAESMLLDLLLLAECDALVGTLSSQMSRAALSLAALRRGALPPFESIDGLPWGCCTWAGEALNTSDPAAFAASPWRDPPAARVRKLPVRGCDRLAHISHG